MRNQFCSSICSMDLQHTCRKHKKAKNATLAAANPSAGNMYVKMEKRARLLAEISLGLPVVPRLS